MAVAYSTCPNLHEPLATSPLITGVSTTGLEYFCETTYRKMRDLLAILSRSGPGEIVRDICCCGCSSTLWVFHSSEHICKTLCGCCRLLVFLLASLLLTSPCARARVRGHLFASSLTHSLIYSPVRPAPPHPAPTSPYPHHPPHQPLIILTPAPSHQPGTWSLWSRPSALLSISVTVS